MGRSWAFRGPEMITGSARLKVYIWLHHFLSFPFFSFDRLLAPIFCNFLLLKKKSERKKNTVKLFLALLFRGVSGRFFCNIIVTIVINVAVRITSYKLLCSAVGTAARDLSQKKTSRELLHGDFFFFVLISFYWW